MKHMIFLLSIFLFLSCNKTVSEIINDMGFAYDSRQDIYVSKVDSPQRKAGYSSLIDLSALPAGMIIDCEPVEFAYKGKKYMIELWKGQYDLSTGAEIGIYKKRNPDEPAWDCGDNDDMLKMSFILKKNGNEIFGRSDKHWWLTGFKPGIFSNPRELTMEITVVFDDRPDMLPLFIDGLKRLGYVINNDNVNGNTIKFLFDRPKKPQPWAKSPFIELTQKKNHGLVELYNKAKEKAMVPDNSPGSIEKMLTQMPEIILHLKKYKKKK